MSSQRGTPLGRDPFRPESAQEQRPGAVQPTPLRARDPLLEDVKRRLPRPGTAQSTVAVLQGAAAQQYLREGASGVVARVHSEAGVAIAVEQAVDLHAVERMLAGQEALDYLRRCGFLDSNGRPTDLFENIDSGAFGISGVTYGNGPEGNPDPSSFSLWVR